MIKLITKFAFIPLIFLQSQENILAQEITWHWQQGVNLLTARQNAAGAASDNAIFVFGGQGNQGFLSSVEKYNPDSQSWNYTTPMPKAACCFAAVFFHGEVYLLGGLKGNPAIISSETWIFNPINERWRAGPSLRTARKNASAVVYGDRIILVGGADKQNNPVGAMDSFDGEKWTPLTQLPTPRESANAIVNESEIWVMGGFTDSPYGTNMVEKYSFLNHEWSAAPNLNQARGQAIAGNLQGNIIIAGGWSPLGTLNTAEIIHPDPNEIWEFLPEFSFSRAGSASVVFQDKLFMFGGGIYQGAGGWDMLRDTLILQVSQ